MKKKIIVVSLVPFAVGFVMDTLINFATVLLPFAWIGLGFLALWGFLTFRLARQAENKWKLLLCLLAVPLAVMLLELLQLLTGGGWPVVTIFTRVYFLPVVRLASLLIAWTGSTTMFQVYGVSFALMAAVAFIGSRLPKK